MGPGFQNTLGGGDHKPTRSQLIYKAHTLVITITSQCVSADTLVWVMWGVQRGDGSPALFQ